LTIDDRAAHVCPVGAILPKRVGYAVPIGERQFDAEPISHQVAYLASRDIPIVPVAAETENS